MLEVIGVGLVFYRDGQDVQDYGIAGGSCCGGLFVNLGFLLRIRLGWNGLTHREYGRFLPIGSAAGLLNRGIVMERRQAMGQRDLWRWRAYITRQVLNSIWPAVARACW